MPVCALKIYLSSCSLEASLQTSFDGMDSDDMTVEKIVRGPSEYSKWENRN